MRLRVDNVVKRKTIGLTGYPGLTPPIGIKQARCDPRPLNFSKLSVLIHCIYKHALVSDAHSGITD